MNLPLAVRNVFRNRWRSALTVGGIAVAVALLVWTQCMTDAMLAQMVRGAVAVEIGHVQIQREDYVEEPSIFHAFPRTDDQVEAIRGVPGVVGASPRVKVYGLVGHEKRSVVARLVGVEPDAEVAVSGLDEGIVRGSWLRDDPPEPPAPREAVLGKGMANLLDVAVGDELVVFLQAANGSLGNDVLEVVGTVSTGNSMLDRSAIYAHLEDVQYLAALDGKLHEIAVLADREHPPRAVAGAIEAALPPPPGESRLVVRPWQDVVPEFAALVEFSDNSLIILYVIVYLIAALGILNTQRMSVLERRREFGVLQAIGMTPARMGRMVVAETLALTALGTVLGVALGAGVAAWHGVAGFDMAMFSDTGASGLSYMGVAFEDRLYFRVTAEAILKPVITLGVVAFLCGLWPARESARLPIVAAIAGRQ
ncbi:MAG: ABC transporter permease [Myxococcota bacterium]